MALERKRRRSLCNGPGTVEKTGDLGKQRTVETRGDLGKQRIQCTIFNTLIKTERQVGGACAGHCARAARLGTEQNACALTERK